MKGKDLKGVKQFEFCDYRNYRSELCHNGGCYAYYERYTRLPDGNHWERRYYTSAEFSYCSKIGCFCNLCNDEEGCNCDYEVVTSGELIKTINATSNIASCCWIKR